MLLLFNILDPRNVTSLVDNLCDLSANDDSVDQDGGMWTILLD